MLVSAIKESVRTPSSVRYWYARNIRPSNIILIRHAQSVFNAKCHKYPLNEIYSKKAEQQFHHDPEIIDCELTNKAIKSFEPQKITNFFKNKSPQNTIFFVSPMLRTLQTAQLILDALNKSYEVKVLPQLSEVLSKICDFSSGVNDKKEQFSNFDFRYFDEWIQENNLCQFAQNWQDPFVDQEIRNTVDSNGMAGKRYLQALKQRFPKPLENAQNCKIRSIQGYKKVFEIASLKNSKNAVIVSHNRILKNIENHLKGSKVEDFENLQIRKVKVAEAPKIQNVDSTINANQANYENKN